MLYTVNKSPLQSNNLRSALRIAPAGMPLLLLEDGVYGATPGTIVSHLVEEALGQRPVYALKADLEARGLTHIIDRVQIIDYDGFVALVEEHQVAPWI